MKKLTSLILLLTTTVFLYGQTPCKNGKAGNYPCKDYDLMSHISASDLGGSSGNDSWGWTDPTTNKEYAIVCLNNGTSFVDISNPIAPVFLGRLPTATSNSTWRDVKVYKNHAFIVSEASNHGLQVFDLTRLRSVSSPQTFTADKRYTGFGNAHNIVINEDSGYAYIVGAQRSGTYRGGPLFIDIRDPKNPKNAGGFLSTGVDPYTHDAQVVTYSGPDADYTGKEILIGSNQKEVVLVDITNKSNPKLISTIKYSDVRYTHQGWFTEDMRYFLLGDELDEGGIGFNTRTIVFDFQDLDNPKQHMSYTGPTAATDHNGYVKGNLFYLANYRAGIRIIDISNIGSKTMTEVGYFDTYISNNSATMDGVWNVYPYFNSGVIVISDIQGGLFLVKKSGPVTNPCVATTPTGVNSSGVGTTSAAIGWTSVKDATYDVRYRQTGTTNWTTNTVSTNSYTITNLTAGTSYEAQVRSKCQSGSPSNYSASVNFTTTSIEINYCDSNGKTTSDEYISNVNIGTINNTTTASSGGYGDYTALSTDISIGNSATITITPKWTSSIYAEAYSVWIDYNKDGDFADAGEQVWSKAASTTTPVSGTFTVPNGATKGMTRMRVSMKYNGVPTPCESFQYGEVEDYTINITEGGVVTSGCSSGITSFPYSEGFENTIGSWTQSATDNLDWAINDNGTPSNNTGPSAASKGTHYLYVEASGSGTGFPNKQAILTSSCFDLTNETSAAFSFEYHMYGASNMGTFLVEASSDNGSSWASVWTQSTNQGNAWKTATVDLAAYVGKNIQLRFNRTTGATWQNDIAIDNISLTTNVSKNDLQVEKEVVFRLYPNPTSGNINLYMEGIERDAQFMIVNVLGQLVRKGNVSNSINTSNLNSGTYFLQIESEGKSFVKRFIKEE